MADAPDPKAAGAPGAPETPVQAPQPRPPIRRPFARPAPLPLSVIDNDSNALNEREKLRLTLAETLGLPEAFLQWTQVPLIAAQGLVLFAPWAHIVLARTQSDILRFLDRYARGHALDLYDSIIDAYPVAVSTPLPALRLLELSLTPALRGFVEWAEAAPREASWPLTPNARVYGSWATWTEAVYVDRGDGTVQLLGRTP